MGYTESTKPARAAEQERKKKNLGTDGIDNKGWQDAIVAWELRARGGCREDRCP